MKIEATTAKFFELAQQIDEKQLKSFFIDLSKIKKSFLLDSIVLARLSGGLSEAQSHLFAEILDILNVKKSSKLLKAVNFAMGFKVGLDAKGLDMSLIKKSPILIESWSEFLIGSGIWTDSETGLMWTSYSLGQIFSDGEVKGVASKYSRFSEVEEEVAKINNKKSIVGLSDWRLPSFDEIEKFMIAGGAGYKKNSGAFFKPNSSDFGCFWTSSEVLRNNFNFKIAGMPSIHKNIDFDKGVEMSVKGLVGLAATYGNNLSQDSFFVRLVHDTCTSRKKQNFNSVLS
jgi:hypothetical protein